MHIILKMYSLCDYAGHVLHVPLFAALWQSSGRDLQIKAVSCQHRVPRGETPVAQLVLEVQDRGGSTHRPWPSHRQPVVLNDTSRTVNHTSLPCNTAFCSNVYTNSAGGKNQLVRIKLVSICFNNRPFHRTKPHAVCARVSHRCKWMLWSCPSEQAPGQTHVRPTIVH